MAKDGTKKQQAAEHFANMFDGDKKPSPEAVIVSVMHGTGNNTVTDRQYQAARDLLPYRLPKLANVEAHVATTEMSHDEWISTLEGDDDD